MRRRELLAGLAQAGSLAGFLSLLPRPARAALKCQPYGWMAEACMVGIASEVMEISASDTQHASEWCWAACIEAIFRYHGHAVTQERIVETVWGKIVNMPGFPPQILAALNREWKDEAGKPFRSVATAMGVNAATAAQDLANDQPLIIGTTEGSGGHAMVLTALQYVRNAAGAGQVVQAIVRDPWPYNPRRRPLTAQEWAGISFAARIRVME